MINPAASTSNGIAAAAQQQQQQILANNAADQIIAAHGPFLQIEQKKVLVYHGEKDIVTVTVIAWCAHMEAMKTSLSWSEDATFCNRKKVLVFHGEKDKNHCYGDPMVCPHGSHENLSWLVQGCHFLQRHCGPVWQFPKGSRQLGHPSSQI